MIQFSTDLRMKNVKKLIGDIVTSYPYRVYGIKEGEAILIEYDPYKISCAKIDKLVDFFKENGLRTAKYALSPDNGNLCKIGLRLDLRKHSVLCACIIETIVYYCEDRLKLEKRDINIPVELTEKSSMLIQTASKKKYKIVDLGIDPGVY